MPKPERWGSVFLVLLLGATGAGAEEIGHVDMAWKLVGPNHRIVVEAFDDPDIANVTCWVSRPVTGGVSGAIGLATNPSNGSIACRQRGPITLSSELQRKLEKEVGEEGAEVFKAKTSPVFKSMQVTRFFDARRDTILYLIWSDRLIDGSPKNSLSVVPISPWPQ
ncbi:MAG: CreA protein [Rhodospirillaceae bacterium]|nr:MAG: CreA protein [Rhodospirillaceae bacterium]